MIKAIFVHRRILLMGKARATLTCRHGQCSVNCEIEAHGHDELTTSVVGIPDFVRRSNAVRSSGLSGSDKRSQPAKYSITRGGRGALNGPGRGGVRGQFQQSGKTKRPCHWRTMLVKRPMSYSAVEQGAINPATTVPIRSSAQLLASGEQGAR
jgi:hypothetical protein